MSRTVTALFDSRSEAEAARERLSASQVDADRVRIIDKSSSGSGSAMGSGTGDAGDTGFWASLKELFIDDNDRHAYGEGIDRGGYLLTADVDEDEADRAIQILDETGSVDFDQRQHEWRSDGWTGSSTFGVTGRPTSYDEDQSLLGENQAGSQGQQLGSSQGMEARAQSTSETGRVVQEEHIPILEEQLRVGKREVERGGARVRSYIRETPVHEQVNLREEHVSVERRPVNQPLSTAELASGDLLGEREIEMRETAEEAVVAKEARVREELVVRKTAEEHVENIDDSVRRTEVDVDEGLRGTGSENRSALFGERNSERGSDLDRDTELDRDRIDANNPDRGRL